MAGDKEKDLERERIREIASKFDLREISILIQILATIEGVAEMFFVAADEASSTGKLGKTPEEKFRNPEDVETIERLKAENAKMSEVYDFKATIPWFPKDLDPWVVSNDLVIWPTNQTRKNKR